MESNAIVSTGKRSRKASEKSIDTTVQISKQPRHSISSRTTTTVVEQKILPSVALSHYDKASQLVLSADQLLCYGCEGGYRMVRATHGVHRGAYLWEVEILPPAGEKAHVRVGWSTRQGELQSSVGFDQHSYGYRDLEGFDSSILDLMPKVKLLFTLGSRVHKSQRVDDYGEPYGPGDVIGCYINLDDNPQLNKIVFYKNGIFQGIAFSGDEVPTGVYFPAISVYMKAVVRANFGPTFIMKYEVQDKVNPISELQPMNPEDRIIHEKNIQFIRQARERQNQS